MDNAATTQKPQVVLDRLVNYFATENSNIHRGVHHLSLIATEAFEKARQTVRTHINAKHNHEVVFTKGATEGINLVANSFGKMHVNEGDEVLLTAMEHHSNLVPWQVLCKERKAKLKVIPFNEKGEIDLEMLERMISEKTKIITVTHISNVLGTILPVKEIVKLAHSRSVPVIIDGAQAIPHMGIDVQDLDCDFYCFSGHKVYGPMGVGVLYGKEEHLEAMPPYQTGGEMVDSVTFHETTYNELPYKFEAGTPCVSGVVGLEAAMNYLNGLDLESVQKHEHELLEYGTQEMKKIESIRIYGEAAEKSSVISFNLENIHPYDAGTILDQLGIAVRTGHHCAQPIMDHIGVPGMIRASFGLYNTKEEIDVLVAGIRKAKEMLS
jgi:cysteine desulfurase/selenocysteine lyase